MTFQRICTTALLLGAFAAGSAFAQSSRIRANVRGGDSSSGKCTFEVNVDGVAEIEIHGDSGYLRTISGQPASWRRLDCSSHFPNNPGDFRFKGVDGRGRQTLVRDPRGSGGVAVIRIEDPQGGAEGYTGDITWSGGDSHWGGGGNWSSGGSGWDDGWSNNSTGIDYKEAVRVCREQVGRVRNVEPNSVSVRRASMGGNNSDYDLEFNYRDRWSNTGSGRCMVNRYGRLSNFTINGGSYNDRISNNQALTTCEKEVERRLSVSSSDVRVQHGSDPGSGNFLINWQARRDGQIRTGQCVISGNGQLSDFRKY
jgi:hypothetical protein